MTLSVAYKEHLKSLFLHSEFRNRDERSIMPALDNVHPGSNIPLTVKPDRIDVEDTTETMSRVTFLWDDYSFQLEFQWRKNEKRNIYVLCDIK